MGYYTTFSLQVLSANGKNTEGSFEKLIIADAQRYKGLTEAQKDELRPEVLKRLADASAKYDAVPPSFWEGYDYCIKGGEAAKWYEHEEDFRALSKAFPEFIFQLDGEGEDHREGALFRKWFYRGWMQGGGVKYVWPELEQGQWK